MRSYERNEIALQVPLSQFTPAARRAWTKTFSIIVTTYSSIHARLLRVVGSQGSGWHAADDSAQNARELPFDFSITDDGAGQFLLVYRSVDGALYGDTWHETLADAYQGAERQFGVARQEWPAAGLGASPNGGGGRGSWKGCHRTLSL